MPSILGQLGGLFKGGNLGSTLSGASAGVGEVGNLLAGVQRSNALKGVQDQQKYIEALGPAGISRLAAGATQPIDNSIRQSVTNGVQADMAERGLSQAPGIFAATESQALAPFAQQNYDRALQSTLASLGLPLEYANTIKTMLPGTTSMTPALTLFLQQLAKRGATTASQTPTGQVPGGGLLGPVTPGVLPDNWAGPDPSSGGAPPLDMSQLVSG